MEIVSNPLGGDVMVVVMGTLVLIVEPKLLVPIIPRKKSAEDVPDGMMVALVTAVWEDVDEAENDKICRVEAVVE